MKRHETESLSRYINQLYREGVSFLGKEYKRYNIGPGQYQFLVYLYMKDGITHDELTEKIGVDKAATTRAVSKLEKSGYINRVQDNKDKRKFYIYLSDNAKNLKREIIDTSKTWERHLMEKLDEEDIESLYKIFRKLSNKKEDQFREEHFN